MKEYDTIEVLLIRQGKTCGKGVATYLKKEQYLSIRYFLIDKEYRTVENMVELLRKLLDEAYEAYRCTQYIWQYFTLQKETDTQYRLTERLDGYEVRQVSLLARKLLLDMGEFLAGKRNGHEYTQGFLGKKGYVLRYWKECGEDIQRQFHQLEVNGEEKLKALLPFVENYDPETSIVILDKKGQVCSWMICCRADQDTMEIRRWYTLEPYRNTGLSIYMGGYVMYHIALKYKYLQYIVKEENAGMQRFTRGFLRKTVIDEKYIKVMEIVRKK